MIKKKVALLINEISKGIYEKEEVVKLSLLSALAGQSIFLIGPPGVAKSLIARRLKNAFVDSTSFEYLMNRFSTPDELFGPISIEDLKVGVYKRLTQRYLPDADIVFLDEIWKAGPSIQNTLLTVINERIFKNGVIDELVNMKLLISASNELPAKGQGLEALWDRFIVRYEVQGIAEEDNFNEMISAPQSNEAPTLDDTQKISADDYGTYKIKIDSIEVPNEVFNVIKFIRAAIIEHNKDQEQKIYISDRRWKKITALLKTSAFINERSKVDLMDCFLIKHCLWDHPEQIVTIETIVARSIQEFGYTPSISFSVITDGIGTFKDEVDREIYEEYLEDEGEGDSLVEVTKSRLISKPLSKYNVTGFETTAQELRETIDAEIAKLDKYVKDELKDIRVNLFVDESLAAHVQDNVDKLKEQLRQMKLDIDIITDSYETLK